MKSSAIDRMLYEFLEAKRESPYYHYNANIKDINRVARAMIKML